MFKTNYLFLHIHLFNNNNNNNNNSEVLLGAIIHRPDASTFHPPLVLIPFFIIQLVIYLPFVCQFILSFTLCKLDHNVLIHEAHQQWHNVLSVINDTSEKCQPVSVSSLKSLSIHQQSMNIQVVKVHKLDEYSDLVGLFLIMDFLP